MESLVLCPEELCLGPAAARVQVGVDTSAEFSMWTNEAVEKGTRFLPWKGTVRSDKLAVYNKLPDFDVSTIVCGYSDTTSGIDKSVTKPTVTVSDDFQFREFLFHCNL